MGDSDIREFAGRTPVGESPVKEHDNSYPALVSVKRY